MGTQLQDAHSHNIISLQDRQTARQAFAETDILLQQNCHLHDCMSSPVILISAVCHIHILIWFHGQLPRNRMQSVIIDIQAGGTYKVHGSHVWYLTYVPFE